MSRTFRILISLAPALLSAWPAAAKQIGDLPGEDVSSVQQAEAKPETAAKPKAAASRPNNWLSPPLEEQLSRDPSLIPLGKGALFIPSYVEPRREPEIGIFNAKGRQVESGQTGERIMLDSGDYTVRFGSGTTAQRIAERVRIQEGHTEIIPPTWGGLIVETLTPNGEYIDGQYEVIRMDKWINYGKGRGLTEERLQDIKAWMLPPGLYRISKPGEGFNTLRNYITVQINQGELTQVELIYDKEGGDIVSGGIKTLNAREKLGSHWSYGARVGGNVNLTRTTLESGDRTEAMQVSSDVRLKVSYDNVRYLGSTNLLLQDNFSKDRGRPFIVTSDIAQLRTNWVRRLNRLLGTYVRGSVESHIFPKNAELDSIYLVKDAAVPGFPDSTTQDTSLVTGAKDFEVTPVLDPMKLAEGLGVNVELLSRYYLEASTQVGFAARQNLAFDSYLSNTKGVYYLGKSKYEIGAENTLDAILRLGSQAALDLRVVIFAPNAVPSKTRLEELTADLRFFLSRNLEVGYIYHVSETDAKVKNRFPSSHNLSLRLSFNY